MADWLATDWLVRATCRHCGRRFEIRESRMTRGGWVAVDVETGERHRCGSDVYDLPDSKRVSLSGPEFKKHR